MFYIWHTLLVAGFLVIVYYLGFKHGVKAKATKISKAKVWKALTKKSELVSLDTVSSRYSNKETSQKDWLVGYHKWKRNNFNANGKKR